MSAMMNPKLMDSSLLSQDVKNRVNEYHSRMITPLGAYSVNSKGYKLSRTKVAEFISKRDGVEANFENVNLTNGASEGCKMALRLAIRDDRDGVLLPIPQYPLYTASMALMKGVVLPYFLDEDKDWGLKIEDIEQRIM